MRGKEGVSCLNATLRHSCLPRPLRGAPASLSVSGFPVEKEPFLPLLWTLTLLSKSTSNASSLHLPPLLCVESIFPRALEAPGLSLCTKTLVNVPLSACCLGIVLLPLDFKPVRTGPEPSFSLKPHFSPPQWPPHVFLGAQFIFIE